MKPKFVALATIALVLVGLGLFWAQSQSDVKAANGESAKTVAVSTAKATLTPHSESLSLVGTLQANRDVQLVSETQGKVKKIYADVGAFLNAGAPIASVDAALKNSTYLAAKARAEKALRDAARYEELFKENNASANDVESAKLAAQIAEAERRAAERQLSDATIRAPFSGFLVERAIEQGAVVQPGTPVGAMIDLASVKMKVFVGERDAFKLRVGDSVRVKTDVYPNRIFYGAVKTIGLKADAVHAFPVEIALSNRDKNFPLRAGQTAKVSFELSERVSLLIPRLALVADVAKPSVYVVENGRAMLRAVSVGQTLGAKIEITEGLAEGETVVVVGHNNLKNNDAVTVKN